MRVRLMILIFGTFFLLSHAAADGVDCSGGAVIIGNMITTCTNSCVVTVDSATGTINVSDCCGGQIHITILPPDETLDDYCM